MNQPVFERSLLPHQLFELFLTNTEMKRICIKSTNYARLKGNHMFTMTVEKPKAFLTIVLVNGYARLPRQEIYWERREDCHNLVVSAILTKTEFLECKRYLHLANNNDLNSSDKLAKGRAINLPELSTCPAYKRWRIHGSLIWKTWIKKVHTWQTHKIWV